MGLFHAASVNTTRGEFELDQVRPLFQISYTAPLGIPYDVAPDGQRFIFATYPESVSTPLVLITNWTAASRNRLCGADTPVRCLRTRSRSTLLNFPCSLLHSRDMRFLRPFVMVVVMTMTMTALATSQTLPAPQAITDPKQITLSPIARVEKSLSIEKLYMKRQVEARPGRRMAGLRMGRQSPSSAT